MTRNAPRLRAALFATLTIALLASCGGGDSKTPASITPGATKPAVSKPPGNSGAGSLIISRPQSLVEFDIKSSAEKPLITPEVASTFILDPAVSPDGNRLAYIVQPPPKVEGNKYDAGSDLWVADRDGTNQRVVFTHVQPNQLIRFPQWEDNDRILAIVQEIATTGGITSVVYTLERIDAATGERTNVLENVLAFTLSPDGMQLVYAKLAPQSGETLESQAPGGGNAKTLVPIAQNLNPFNSPRFSPDGATIAFASADQTGARVAPSVQFVLLRRSAPGDAWAARPAAATLFDGLPEDIWTVDAAGGAPPVRLADLKEDLPALTWSGDGKHIFVIGSAGLYDVNIKSGAVDRIGEGAFHGQLAWAP